jgi:hypothetical protein
VHARDHGDGGADPVRLWWERFDGAGVTVASGKFTRIVFADGIVVTVDEDDPDTIHVEIPA